MISIDVSIDGMEKEKTADVAKATHSKSSSHLKKERINSGKSNLAETDLLEKKISRKVSVASSKNELGSARGRKSSKMEKACMFLFELFDSCYFNAFDRIFMVLLFVCSPYRVILFVYKKLKALNRGKKTFSIKADFHEVNFASNSLRNCLLISTRL